MNYLATGASSDQLRLVGDDLVVSVPENEYEPSVRIVMPGEGAARNEWTSDASLVDNKLVAKLPDIGTSGVYQVELTRREGGVERRVSAFNVVTRGEGDLHLVSSDEIKRRLADVPVELHDADDLVVDEEHLAGFQLGNTLLGTMIALLLAEQWLAYSASYHLPSGSR
jgi:hypothetical protein